MKLWQIVSKQLYIKITKQKRRENEMINLINGNVCALYLLLGRCKSLVYSL